MADAPAPDDTTSDPAATTKPAQQGDEIEWTDEDEAAATRAWARVIAEENVAAAARLGRAQRREGEQWHGAASGRRPGQRGLAEAHVGSRHRHRRGAARLPRQHRRERRGLPYLADLPLERRQARHGGAARPGRAYSLDYSRRLKLAARRRRSDS